MAGIAELGVVFLLFLIGLELSYQRLAHHAAPGVRPGQPAGGDVHGPCSAAIAALFDIGAAASLIIGGCLALSSTAIVIEILSNQRRLTTTAGRASFSILLAQDLAVVPLLLFISLFGTRTGGSMLASLGLALAQAALAVALIVVVGRLLLRPIFRLGRELRHRPICSWPQPCSS